MNRIILGAACAAAALLAFSAPSFATTIFVSNEKDNTITVVNGETLEVIKTIKVSRRPRGIVLSPDGGALKAQLPAFRLGVGGKAGSGEQWMPWITLDDEVRALRFLLDHDVAGPVNLVGPHPVTNAELTRTLGRVLGRPTFMTIPRLAGRLPLGVGPLVDSLLFDSARVLPAVLLAAGFTFLHPDLETALRDLLHRPAA